MLLLILAIHASIHAFNHSSIHVSIHPSISPTHVHIHPSIHPSIHSSIHLHMHPSIYACIHTSIPCMHPSIHPCVHPSIHQSTCPSVFSLYILSNQFTNHNQYFSVTLPLQYLSRENLFHKHPPCISDRQRALWVAMGTKQLENQHHAFPYEIHSQIKCQLT